MRAYEVARLVALLIAGGVLAAPGDACGQPLDRPAAGTAARRDPRAPAAPVPETQLHLVGVVLAEPLKIAFIELAETDGRRRRRVAEGESVGGYRLVQVEMDRVWLERDGPAFSLLLARPAAPAAPPGAPMTVRPAPVAAAALPAAQPGVPTMPVSPPPAAPAMPFGLPLGAPTPFGEALKGLGTTRSEASPSGQRATGVPPGVAPDTAREGADAFLEALRGAARTR